MFTFVKAATNQRQSYQKSMTTSLTKSLVFWLFLDCLTNSGYTYMSKSAKKLLQMSKWKETIQPVLEINCQ